MSEIDWSGGTIPVGQFGEFNVLAQGIPSGTDQLVFKAIQLYSNGTTVSWIQVPDRAAPDPAHPAPILTLTPPGRRGAGASTDTTTASAPGPVSATATPASSGNSHVLAVVALILAGFAVVLGVLAVWLGRPGCSTPSLGPKTTGTTQSRVDHPARTRR